MLSLVSELFLLLCVCSLTHSLEHITNIPRMVFTEKETSVKKLSLPGHGAPIRTLINKQMVTYVGQTQLYMSTFHHHEKIAEKNVHWKKCEESDCSYKITVVHQWDDEHLFLCGVNGKDTTCCNVNLTQSPFFCAATEKIRAIGNSIEHFITKEGEHSVLLESGNSADLYVTQSGNLDTAGIYKFGSKRVRPANHDKEQHYVGLVTSRGRSDPLQDKVYAFYRQRNKDTGMYSETWLPYVSQVCMADSGGPKNKLQNSWTSQLNARLLCGDQDSKVHFSELVDVSTVHAAQWNNTKVYALFRNEWGISAVCVYTLGGIDGIFTSSPFKEDPTMKRERKCVPDSTKISSENLMKIEKASEMEHEVKPASFFFLPHNYTHIKVDTSWHHGSSGVIFLSSNNGRIHKVVHKGGDFFIIAEYQPFNTTTHIHSMFFQPSSKMLYVNSRIEVVQLNVENCAQYGNTCEDCELSRDPYCSWSDSTCTSKPREPSQDIIDGSYINCASKSERVSSEHKNVMVGSGANHFLECPVSSQHAQYTWDGPEGPKPCEDFEDNKCICLLRSMGPRQTGIYKCVREERGYRKVVAEVQLQLGSTACRTGSPPVWVCLIAFLMMTFWY